MNGLDLVDGMVGNANEQEKPEIWIPQLDIPRELNIQVLPFAHQLGGKSFLFKMIAEYFNATFGDVDDLILEIFVKPLGYQTLVSFSEGYPNWESKFREFEHMAVLFLLHHSDIIGFSGGAMSFERNRNAVSDKVCKIFLDVEVKTQVVRFNDANATGNELRVKGLYSYLPTKYNDDNIGVKGKNIIDWIRSEIKSNEDLELNGLELKALEFLESRRIRHSTYKSVADIIIDANRCYKILVPEIITRIDDYQNK